MIRPIRFRHERLAVDQEKCQACVERDVGKKREVSFELGTIRLAGEGQRPTLSVTDPSGCCSIVGKGKLSVTRLNTGEEIHPFEIWVIRWAGSVKNCERRQKPELNLLHQHFIRPP